MADCWAKFRVPRRTFLETKLGNSGKLGIDPHIYDDHARPDVAGQDIDRRPTAHEVVDHLGGNVGWISTDPLRRDAMITGEHED